MVVLCGTFWFYASSTSSEAGAVDLRGSARVSIVLTDKGFEPQYAKVKAGTVVVFTTTRDKEFWPASNPHPSHTLYPEFDPKRPIEPSDSWTFVPQRVGTWGYHDHIRSYFTGILYVE